MSRNQRRKLSTGMSVAGIIETAAGAKVSNDIQLTYQLDDLNLLFDRLRRPFFLLWLTSVLNVARRGIIEIQAPADSAILLGAPFNHDGANFVSYHADDFGRITDNLGSAGPNISLGGVPSRAIIRQGTTTIGPHTPQIGSSAQYPASFPPIVLYPGDIFSFITNAVNTTARMQVAWHEVPLIADSD